MVLVWMSSAGQGVRRTSGGGCYWQANHKMGHDCASRVVGWWCDQTDRNTCMAMPRVLAPMLAVPGGDLDLTGPGWSHEFKWDGIRVLVHADGPDRQRGHRITTRNGNDVTAAWPELDGMLATLPADTVVDGELVVLDDDLRPDFSRIAHRMHVRNPLRIAELRATHPAQFMAFDLLRVSGQDVMGTGLEERRARLADIVPAGGPWAVPPASPDHATMLTIAEQRGLEGIVSKRVGSVYEPGVRSRNWRKTRRVQEADAVVIGHRGLGGATSGAVTSLALARWDLDQAAWVGEGSVGSGLTEAEGVRLRELLEGLTEPVDHDVSLPDGFVAVPPVVVVRVSHLEATSQGHFRHPVYKGQRHDIDAGDVTDLP